MQLKHSANGRDAIVDPADLLIDAENPRIEQPNVGQHEAVEELARHLGAGLLVLAADIVQVGTNPSTLPIVMESAGDPGRYVLLEGADLLLRRTEEDPRLVAACSRPVAQNDRI